MTYQTLRSSFLTLLIYACTLVIGGDALLVYFRGIPLFSEWDVELTKTAIAFLPFALWIMLWTILYLLQGDRVNLHAYRLGIRVGVGASLVIWGYYFYDAIFGLMGDANIGMGVLLLFSPVIILLIMLTSWAASR